MLKSYDAYLVGYYGMQNSGDDALMYAAAWGAKHQLGCQKVKVSCDKDVNCSELTDVKGYGEPLFKGHQRLRHYQSAIASKRVIFGGGSVFHSEKDIEQKRHMIALASRKKSLALGVSLGPFVNTAAEKACAQFLKECGFVGVRDQSSFELAKSLAPNANVKLTFDLAPSLLCNKKLSLSKIERHGIAFNFCQSAVNAFGDTDSHAEQARISRAVELIKLIWNITGEHIFLVDFNGHPQLGDQKVHNAIMERLSPEIMVSHVPYDPNPLRLLQRMFMFRALIGMRLHAAVFGYMAETPTIFLQYHKKCRQWSKQIGMPDAYQYDANGFSAEEVAIEICNSLSCGFYPNSLPLHTAIKRSLSNWSSENEQDSIFSRYTSLQQA